MSIRSDIDKWLCVFRSFLCQMLIVRDFFSFLYSAILCNVFCIIQVGKHRNVLSEELFENVKLETTISTENLTNEIKSMNWNCLRIEKNY